MIDYNSTKVNAYNMQGKDFSTEVELLTAQGGFGIDISSSSPDLCKVVIRWDFSLPGGMRILGDHWERGYGDMEWRGIIPERVLPWYCILHCPQSGESIGFGVQVGAGAFASWKVDQEGITLILDVKNGSRGVNLQHRTLHAADVRTLKSQNNETAFQFARRFCQVLCPNPRLPKQPVYGGNDWYHTYGNSSEEVIIADAAFIRSHSKSVVNAPFMMVDCGWFPARECNGGPYDKGCHLFPDMPGLAAKIKSEGVRPGIWIRPLLTAAAPESWRFPVHHPVQKSLKQTVLDPSVSEVLQQVQADIRRLCDWGYELIKFDFSTYDIAARWGEDMLDGEICGGDWNFADQTKTSAEIIKQFYEAIRDAAGDRMLMGCNTVGHLGAGIFEIQRTGDDTSGQEWERTRKMGINSLAFRMMQHETFFSADADCVGLTKMVPWKMNRQWLELVAASGTPLFVSADPAAVQGEQHAVLSDALTRAASVQDPGEPLDWMETTCPRIWRFGSETRQFNWHNPEE
jgi:alpha-galactosidase